MDYKELQNKAKELNLPYVGISREDLEKSIKEAESDSKTPHSKAKSKKEEVKFNAVVVRDGKNEVRRFSAVQHGDDFEKLARGFAEKMRYQVELVTEKDGVKCPNCGYMFNPA